MKNLVDLRSDTVTSPSKGMLECVLEAKTGDDVYGEDPTANQLESYVASLTKKEKALFVTSGTQGNLTAILAHCQRGDEYIAGSEAHTYKYEAGGAAVLGSVQPQPIPFNSRGEIPLDLAELALKPDNNHFARTRLLCLENTNVGKVLSLAYLSETKEFAFKNELKVHLDGARAFNAAAKLDVPISEITKYADTCSLCLSKGLGAPMGSVLVGDSETIDRARRWRKMLGGGMRQAGLMAAAGMYALENNLDSLKQDQLNAASFASGIRELQTLGLEEEPQTNMVIIKIDDHKLVTLKEFLKKNNVLISSRRFVFHRDISTDSCTRLIDLMRVFDESY